MVPCPYCAAGLHAECENPGAAINAAPGFLLCCCATLSADNPTAPKVIGVPRGPYKTGEEAKDVLSTGRKRAAEIIPFDGQHCEWAYLKYAGGGVEPIVGCDGNVVQARHHGPDKNTFNNDRSNLHGICHRCHNRWHSKNDKYYDEPRPAEGKTWEPNQEFKPHDPDTKASLQDMIMEETKWPSKKKK